MAALEARNEELKGRAYICVDESQMDRNAFYKPLRILNNFVTVAVVRVAFLTASHTFTSDCCFGPEVLAFTRPEFDAAMLVSLTKNMTDTQKCNLDSSWTACFSTRRGTLTAP